MKKLEFLNPSLFKVNTNIKSYLNEEISLIQISGYYTNNEWINVGFYIKPTNIVTTVENNNTITYLVYDLSTKKYSFTNSLANASINKLYFKLYVYNNKFYVSPNNITQNLNIHTSTGFAYTSLSTNFSNTSIYSLTTKYSEFANTSLTTDYSISSLYSLTSEFSTTTSNVEFTNKSNFANKSLTAIISLSSLYSLSANNGDYALLSLTTQNSLSTFYSTTSLYTKNASTILSIVEKFTLFSIPYTKLSVSTSFPATANLYDSFYNINTKELFVYAANSWQPVEWQIYIKSDRLYKEGKLRINNTTGALEIQSANGIWHEIIPTIGKAFTPTSYTKYVYYIATNQIFAGFSTTIVPLMAISSMKFKGMLYFVGRYSGPAGLRPNGIVVSDGVFSTVQGYHDNIYGTYRLGSTFTNQNYIHIAAQYSLYIDTPTWAKFSIDINNNQMQTTAISNGGDSVVTVNSGCGTFPNIGFYLGTLTTGYPTTITIRREY
jgi:hypothetical protein